MKKSKLTNGFTLIEMMLVLVIASSLLLMMLNYGTQKTDQLRRDRVALQTQQILSAALSYYVNKGTWPSCTTPPCNFDSINGNDLQSFNYTPRVVMKNPWGNSYSYNTYNNSNNFVVYTNVATVVNAQTTVGQLPMGFMATPAGAASLPPVSTGCTGGTLGATCTYAVSSITIPGQNLNNARSINFAGLYHNGSCVPAPVCPTGMSRRIFVTPTQVTGSFFGGSPPATYPVTAFSAYAIGPIATPANPTACSTGVITGVNNCGALTDAAAYWRVCLDVITNVGGPVSASGQGQNQTVLAITRCEPTSEPAGSAFTVYTP